MSELIMTEKELLEKLLTEFDYVLQAKYANNEDAKNKVIERQYQLLKLKLSMFNTANIEQLENQYKN